MSLALIRQRIGWLAPVLTVFVLGAMAAQPMLHARPADADAYFARVRAAATIPMTIGDWHGEDTPVPQAAIQMLRPNVVISRRYRNVRTGVSVGLLVMECEDSRDLAGHYPPNCYPGNGWTLVHRQPETWKVGERSIDGVEYEFFMNGAVQQGRIYASNFLLLPDGSFVRDMAQFQRLAFDYKNRYYGAAQVQVVFDGNTLPEDRHAGVVTFVGACEPLLSAIGSGRK